MRELNMIDTMGYGIHQMYADQKKRYLPLHDYDLSDRSVRMTIYGHVVDEAYSSLLVKRPDLSLEDVCLLDRIQKHLAVSASAIAHLRHEGLVEGRMPHVHISARIAAITGQEVEYVKAKRRTGERLRSLIKDFLGQWGAADRKKIDELLMDELDKGMSAEVKHSKITNILAVMRRKGEIRNEGTDHNPIWRLTRTKTNERTKSL